MSEPDRFLGSHLAKPGGLDLQNQRMRRYDTLILIILLAYLTIFYCKHLVTWINSNFVYHIFHRVLVPCTKLAQRRWKMQMPSAYMFRAKVDNALWNNDLVLD